MPGSVRRTRRSGPTPGPPPLALSRALAAPSGRAAIRGVAHTVRAIWPCAFGMASGFISRRDGRADQPMGKSVGVSRGGTSARLRFLFKADLNLRRCRAPRRARADVGHVSSRDAIRRDPRLTRYDAIPGLSEFVGDPPRDRTLGR